MPHKKFPARFTREFKEIETQRLSADINEQAIAERRYNKLYENVQTYIRRTEVVAPNLKPLARTASGALLHVVRVRQVRSLAA